MLHLILLFETVVWQRILDRCTFTLLLLMMSRRLLSISQESLLPESSALIAGGNSVGEEALADGPDTDDGVETGEPFFLRMCFKRRSDVNVPTCYN